MSDLDKILHASPYSDAEGFEPVGIHKRVFVGIFVECFFALGEALNGVFAFFLRDWVHLQIMIGCTGIAIAPILWFIPESPRWLLQVGRVDKAHVIMRKAAQMNGKVSKKNPVLAEQYDNPIPMMEAGKEIEPKAWNADPLKSNESTVGVAEAASNQEVLKESILEYLKVPRFQVRFIILGYIWMVCSMVYYGLSTNSSLLEGSVHLNFILVMLVEIPGNIITIFLLDRIGRRNFLSGAFILSGVAVIGSGFTQKLNVVRLLLYLIGKMAVASAFNSTYMYTGELYPTTIRGMGIGTAAAMSRIGGMVSPFIAALAEVDQSLPNLIFGGASIVAGLVLLKLPETMNKKLPGTIAEAKECN
ncbi:unnamed protein product [Cyprideis torosa]|uniref:Uncharacterized protein n=1 Tax=Cyprideis torosa TaxID=163714 RepID=A0A7R8WER3_9CRUS|nr:unnamed protein product [Cyprideis torosa]CAG0896132.1 unnamed protein product [Cyprideis torosa]